MSKDRASRVDEFIARPRRAIWVLAAPMIGSMAVHTIYMVVDTAFIGSLGKEALAGVTFVGPLFFVLIALINGLGTAITALVAQAIGRRDRAEAERVASSAVAVALGLGVLFVAAGLLAGPAMLRALGARGETWRHAWAYFEVMVYTVPLFFVGASLRSVLAGEGDATTPMVIFAVATVINVVLDVVFIFGLGLGVRGAALATTGAQVTSLGIYAYVLLVRRRSLVRYRASLLGLHRPLLRGLVVIGLPTTLGQLIMAAGMAANNRVLAHFGESAVAGYGAASRVDMFVAMPIFGLAGAAVAVLGMFAGAGRPDLIRATALYTYRWAITLAVVMGLGAYLASGTVIRIFIREPAAVAVGSTYLGYMLAIYPMMAFGATTGRILQGLGHGVPSLVITLVRVLLVAVPIAVVAVFVYDQPVTALWTAMIIGGVCSTAISVVWVRELLWKRDPTLASARPRGDASR